MQSTLRFVDIMYNVVHGQPHEMRSGNLGNSWIRAEKKNHLCTFWFGGSGVPPIIVRTSEIESSDDLRSELCTAFLSEVD